MGTRNEGLAWACAASLLAIAAPAQAQRNSCNSSQDAAVQCFVKNAVNTGLATLPAGMTLTQYLAYGVSVSSVVQSPPTVVFVLGTMGAVADALPPSNANGTPNQAAQDSAASAIIDAGLKDGLISLPSGTTADQLKMMAHEVCLSMSQNTGVTISPGALLRFLDASLISATSADGTVDWSKVRSSISGLVDSLISGGLLKLPAGVTADGVKQFGYDLTVAIQAYKAATGKSKL